MNSKLVHESSQNLAKALLTKTANLSKRQRTSWMIKHLLGRDATDEECLKGEQFVQDYGDEKEAWAAFARVLFSSNEFLYVE